MRARRRHFGKGFIGLPSCNDGFAYGQEADRRLSNYSMKERPTRSESIAFDMKPEGFVRVRSGPIFDDDLIFSEFERPPRFRRADDPEWQGPPLDDAGDATFLCRRPRYQAAPGQSTRSYTIRKPAMTPDPTLSDRATSDSTLSTTDPQGSLF